MIYFSIYQNLYRCVSKINTVCSSQSYSYATTWCYECC